jgi:hypothetical protein
VQVLAGACGQVAAGTDLGGDVGAEAGGELEQQVLVGDVGRARGEAQRRGGVGRAAGQPGGHRDALVDAQPHRRPAPSGPPPKGPQRNGGEVGGGRAVHPRTDQLVGHRPERRGLERHAVGQGQRLEDGDELVAAVAGARGPEEQAQVELGRGLLVKRRHASASARARKSPGDSRSARASGG